jgi:hypothetical protein
MTLLPLLLALGQSTASCADDSVCVPKEDLRKMVQVLKERKCLDDNPPSFKLDPVVIVTDEDGRVFYSGAKPEPYTVKMTWCHYEVEAQGEVKVVAALGEKSEWGFRFRPKAHLSYLLNQPFHDGNSFNDGVDAGLALDFFHVYWANLNAVVGFRSAGLSIGIDLTRNFGGHVGYAVAFEEPWHNLETGIYFAF